MFGDVLSWAWPFINGLLLGLLIEGIRHQRSLLTSLDGLRKGRVVNALLVEAIEHSRETGTWDDLEPRLERRYKRETGDIIREQQQMEGRFERVIRRYLMD